MTYTLKQITEACGATERAIKLWESRGLLGAVERESERRRTYTEGQVECVRFIIAAQMAGWSLERIQGSLLNYVKLRQSLTNRIHVLQQVRAGMREGWDL